MTTSNQLFLHTVKANHFFYLFVEHNINHQMNPSLLASIDDRVHNRKISIPKLAWLPIAQVLTNLELDEVVSSDWHMESARMPDL